MSQMVENHLNHEMSAYCICCTRKLTVRRIQNKNSFVSRILCSPFFFFPCCLHRCLGLTINRPVREYTWSKEICPTICKKKKAKPTRSKARVVKARARARARGRAMQTQGTTYVMVLRSASYLVVGTQLILGTIYATHGRSNFHSLHKAVRAPTRTRIRTNNKMIEITILMVSSLGQHLHKADGVVVAVVMVTVDTHPGNKMIITRTKITIGSGPSRHLHKTDEVVVVVTSMQDRNAGRRRA